MSPHSYLHRSPHNFRLELWHARHHSDTNIMRSFAMSAAATQFVLIFTTVISAVVASDGAFNSDGSKCSGALFSRAANNLPSDYTQEYSTRGTWVNCMYNAYPPSHCYMDLPIRDMKATVWTDSSPKPGGGFFYNYHLSFSTYGSAVYEWIDLNVFEFSNAALPIYVMRININWAGAGENCFQLPELLLPTSKGSLAPAWFIKISDV